MVIKTKDQLLFDEEQLFYFATSLTIFPWLQEAVECQSIQIKSSDFLHGSTALTFAVISCWNCQNNWRLHSSSCIATVATDAETGLFTQKHIFLRLISTSSFFSRRRISPLGKFYPRCYDFLRVKQLIVSTQSRCGYVEHREK